MGRIVQLFHRSRNLPPRFMSKAFFLDVCENIHIHYRDLRLEFTLEEYFDFMDHMDRMRDGLKEWKAANPDWRESDKPEEFNNREVQWVAGYTPAVVRLPEKSSYWDDRISLEENENGVYHFHWRNYRIEMSRDSFARCVSAFEEAGQLMRKEAEGHRGAPGVRNTALYRRLRGTWLARRLKDLVSGA